MEIATQETAYLVDRLVDDILAPLRRDGIDIDAAARRSLSFALKAVGNRQESVQQQDEALAIQLLRRKFAHLGHSQKAARLDDLQHALVMSGTPLETRTALMNALAAIPQQHDSSAPGAQPGLLPAVPRQPSWPPQGASALKENVQPSNGKHPTPDGNGHSKGVDAEPRMLAEVAETSLVRDVLCACQGFDGHYVRYNPRAVGGLGGFDIAPEAGIPRVQRQLMLRICELGWLFRKLERTVKEAASEDSSSAIRQAYLAALQQELSSLYQLMAQLDALAGHPLPAGEDTGAPYLTLKRLAVWVSEPMLRLKTLASLTDALETLPAGKLIAALDAAAQHGDPSVSATVERCLAQACTPLLEMICCWLFEGRLSSAAGDFFIISNPLPNEGRVGGCLWRDGFRLDEVIRPPFVTLDLAETLLRAGKSLNFLRECCSDTAFEQSLAASALAAAASQLSHGKMDDLERVVKDTAAAIDRHVMTTMLEKHGFAAHCNAIKRYLLLGQGDFVAALIEGMNQDLGKDVADISVYSLNSALDTAARASSAQYDDPDVIARLQIRLEESVGTETGWEVFGIKYTVHEPLSTVLNQVAEGSYQAVASLLWKLKRAEHSLSAAWLSLNGMQRIIGQASAVAKQHNIFLPGRVSVWKLLQSCHALRNEMAHLCGQLQAYLMFEVLERAWVELTEKLASVTHLDDLIGAHEQYLDYILKGAMLEREDGELQRELSHLLSALIQLQPLLRNLQLEVDQALVELTSRVRLHSERSQAGQWARVSDDSEVRGIPEERISEVEVGVSAVKKDYYRALRNFVALLPAQIPVDLEFLLP
ncbi:g12698 [Coccomyxa viridis]|uniref:G12698 protein n=1 Tax=Coccomyxa viridis TaxID=1274662 RepID=A0ABP1GAZ5_9CHLO